MNDTDILARTLYGEAEGHDRDDAVAIAHVVLNRVTLPNWPNTISSVCMQPWQFSCWLADNPRRQKLIEDKAFDVPWLAECYDIARACENGTYQDPTHRATHYYASYMKEAPRWAKGKVPSYTDPKGKYHHRYFNNIDTPPPADAKQALDEERPLLSTRTFKGGQVAGWTGTLTAVAGAASVIEPALPILDWIKANLAFAMIGVGIAVVIGVGVMLVARADDRQKGMR